MQVKDNHLVHKERVLKDEDIIASLFGFSQFTPHQSAADWGKHARQQRYWYLFEDTTRLGCGALLAEEKACPQQNNDIFGRSQQAKL